MTIIVFTTALLAILFLSLPGCNEVSDMQKVRQVLVVKDSLTILPELQYPEEISLTQGE